MRLEKESFQVLKMNGKVSSGTSLILTYLALVYHVSHSTRTCTLSLITIFLALLHLCELIYLFPSQVVSVKQTAITKKKDSRNAVALDSENDTIQVKDIVKVIDGPHSVSLPRLILSSEKCTVCKEICSMLTGSAR